MSNHEYFQELSALAATGQLSSVEEKELSSHLADCEVCSSLHDDYSHIIQHQLPKLSAGSERRRIPAFRLPPDSEIRNRFLGRARAEGVNFSLAAESPTDVVKRKKLLWNSRPMT